MTPQQHTTPVPQGYTLEAPAACQPRGEERPLLRDDAGHVLAQVERVVPDGDAVN